MHQVDCSDIVLDHTFEAGEAVTQQMMAVRRAVCSQMAGVLEHHLLKIFTKAEVPPPDAVEELLALVRPYFR
jgi:DNA-binding FrmR family transcriptional regulator